MTSPLEFLLSSNQLGFQPTNEQGAVINDVHNDGRTPLKIEAIAGSGKTTLLQLTSKADPNRRGVFLTFGRKAANDAKKGFPAWIKVTTTHGLAMGWFLSRNQSHKDKIFSKLQSRDRRLGDIAGIIEQHNGFLSLSATHIAMAARDTMRAYQNSSDDVITDDHYRDSEVSPKEIFRAMIRMEDKYRPLMASARLYSDELNASDPDYKLFQEAKDLALDGFQKYKALVVEKARILWSATSNIQDPCYMEHDTYLKLYQLSKPVINYSYVLWDEVQDSNDCVIDIVTRQSCQVVAVGDPYQQLYAWRGAVNAMDVMDWKTLPLTQSWRYGEMSARLATAVLRHAGFEGEIKGNPNLPTKIDHNPGYPLAVLSRTNGQLLDSAFSYLQKIDAGEQIKLHISINQSLAELADMLEGAYWLFAGQPGNVSSERMSLYNTWKEVVEDSKDDASLARIVKLVNEKSDGCLRIAELFRNHKNAEEDDADVTLVTAHRAKGLEFEHVILADDFPSADDEEQEERALSYPEVCLLYVALTRAKQSLSPNSALRWHMEYAGLDWQGDPVPVGKDGIPVGKPESSDDLVAAIEETSARVMIAEIQSLLEQVETIDINSDTALQELDAISEERKDLQLRFDSMLDSGAISDGDQNQFDEEMTSLFRNLGAAKVMIMTGAVAG